MEISSVDQSGSLLDDQWRITWLRALKNRHAALLRQKTIYWGQRAKNLWLSGGDTNSSFFHKAVKIRNHKNKIKSIKDISGAMGAIHDSPINAELDAICLALSICRERNWIPDRIYTDCPGAARMVLNPHPCIAWQSAGIISKLKNIIQNFQHTCISTIPREDNLIADELAAFGSHNPLLSLFFRGLDRPNWLEELCSSLHLCF
ncbi:uncharacterized protein LOC120281392 [Dioscorea cayenensis subsp. rotundata]|uniref:Uncharacterized protein LOC120281392 n=1 Tax=Dioscorea cayennensis subsp. rotundata TaxID=55577 RepID=A0AB40CVX9_DIOCR|nr:uncharacterized protein LOC120281392 [Dioscorea cayenensis subsp. rotundata]